MEYKRVFGTILAGVVAALSVVHIGRQLDNSQLLMHREYKSIKKIVNAIAQNNDLGSNVLTFTIIPGPTMKWYMDDLNICSKRKYCSFYSSINPYKKYSGKYSDEINEALRQTFIYGFPGGYASKTNLIGIYRTTFRNHENNKNLLTCVISHELGHLSQLYNSKNEWLNTEKFQNENPPISDSKEIQRQSEITADIQGSLMLYNAGFKIDTCLKVRDKWLKATGTSLETKPDQTHPGYSEWMNAFSNFIEQFEKNPSEVDKKFTNGKWQYSRELNVLKFLPKS